MPDPTPNPTSQPQDYTDPWLCRIVFIFGGACALACVIFTGVLSEQGKPIPELWSTLWPAIIFGLTGWVMPQPKIKHILP